MPTDVYRDDVRRLVNAGAILVEVLPAEEYGGEHLPGAINLSLKELYPARVRNLDRERPTVVYCNDYE